MQILLNHEIVKIYPEAGHIIPGNLKIISNSRIRYIVSKESKIQVFKICKEEIASALNGFGNR